MKLNNRDDRQRLSGMASQEQTGTRMRGKAQPDGRPALQIIKTPFLYFSPLLDQSTRAAPLFG